MERSSKLMRLALQEAARFRHDCVSTEHLLLALAGLRGTAVARALASHGISHGSLIAAFRQILEPGTGEAPIYKLPYTPYLKRALERSIEEARGLGHQIVEPEHVLLGILADDQSVAVSALARLGVSPDSLRLAVLKEAGWL